MNLTRRTLAVALAVAASSTATRPAIARGNSGNISIAVPEVYELANILLALTPYGIADEYEVQKDNPYYARVAEHFRPFASHPLIGRINYSRERWEEYLSFRSDAYAFRFRGNRIERTFPFQANAGVDPFTEHLAEVQDFARTSRFRAFFRANRRFYRAIETAYARSYFINESRAFLEREFGSEFSGEYRVVISPLVGRMNAQRTLSSGAQIGLVSVAPDLLRTEGREDLPMEARLEEFHTLLTEMDHIYVNPITASHAEEVELAFDWRAWTRESGYDSNQAAFNEYMTWALYDVMIHDLDVEAPEIIIANWHRINRSRGFLVSEMFAEKVLELHRARPGVRIRDLYPDLLHWSAEKQRSISIPTILSPLEPVARNASGPTPVTIRFSEPMRARTDFSGVPSRLVGQEREAGPLTAVQNARWSQDHIEVSFEHTPMDGPEARIAFSGRGAPPFVSAHGVYADIFRIHFSDV